MAKKYVRVECWNNKAKNNSTSFKNGHIPTENNRLMSKLSNTGRPAWNKGLKGVQKAWNKGLKGSIPWNKGKGTKCSEALIIRRSNEYKLWRTSVFVRDGFTCVFCGVVGGRLNADHIKPFSLFPELRLAIDNGRTLCEPCHRTTDTFAGNSRKKKGDLLPQDT